MIQSTTKKIVNVQGNRTIRDNKKYQQMRFDCCSVCVCVCVCVCVYLYVLCVFADRKQDFREFKQLQREEMKEATDFYNRIRFDKETQDKKFEAENQVRQRLLV